MQILANYKKHHHNRFTILYLIFDVVSQKITGAETLFPQYFDSAMLLKVEERKKTHNAITCQLPFIPATI